MVASLAPPVLLLDRPLDGAHLVLCLALPGLVHVEIEGAEWHHLLHRVCVVVLLLVHDQVLFVRNDVRLACVANVTVQQLQFQLNLLVAKYDLVLLAANVVGHEYGLLLLLWLGLWLLLWLILWLFWLLIVALRLEVEEGKGLELCVASLALLNLVWVKVDTPIHDVVRPGGPLRREVGRASGSLLLLSCRHLLLLEFRLQLGHLLLHA